MKVPRIGVAAALFCKKGEKVLTDRLLLIKRGIEPAKGQWSFPGGKLRWGETLVDGARREIVEETSLNRVFPIMDYPYTVSEAIVGDEFHYVLAHMLFYVEEKDIGVLAAGDDADDACFVTTEKLLLPKPVVERFDSKVLEPNAVFVDSFQKVLKRAINNSFFL